MDICVIMGKWVYTVKWGYTRLWIDMLADIFTFPVIDKNWNMICFAYQDDEADREIRMLDELKEHKNALGFGDIYSKYSYVTIHECNELAYFFGYI